jgi:predicted metal-dependent hydrolase
MREFMDARLREGIELFNQGRFFDCHEVLEGLYLKTEDAKKPILEGLIHLAAAFRMFCDFGEVKGAVRMIYQALIRFENYQPAFLRVRVQDLCTAAEAWAKAAERGEEKPSASSIPKIQIQRFSFFR